MKATFDHSVKVLLKAYLNDTLEHSNCQACAVGNLVADANNYKITIDNRLSLKVSWVGETNHWDDVFMTCCFLRRQTIKAWKYNGKSKQQIDSTGYSMNDLAKIEYAFEMADRGITNDDWIFNGLMAVIDVLAEIHNVDLNTVKETKELFI